jgi:imidazolonepropionase-like amidohydrolase
MTNELVIRGAAVWTGGEKSHLADVVVRDGVIAAVGESGSATGTVIDGAGKTLIPGLIDAHVHLTTPSEHHHPRPNADFRSNTGPGEKALHGHRNALKALSAGVTTLRVIGHRGAGEAQLRDLIDRGSYIGPRLKVAPWWVSTTGGHGDLFFMKGTRREPFDTVDGPYACRQLVRMQAADGADFIKVMASGGVMSAGDKPEWPNYTVEELSATVDEAHGFGLPVAAHAHSREGIRRSLEAGVDSIEHGTDLDHELRAQMVEQGTFLVPTLLIAAEVNDSSANSVVSLEMREAMRELLDKQMGQLAAAHEAGVKIAFGTDTSGIVCPFGRHARELSLYVEAGMKPAAAMRTYAIGAAELLNISGETGTIEPGKSADLVLIDGDPLSDISVLTRPGAVERVIAKGVDVTAYCRTHEASVLD